MSIVYVSLQSINVLNKCLGQVSSEAVAAPLISEAGHDLSKKKKHRMSDPGALVIEHAEASDAG